MRLHAFALIVSAGALAGCEPGLTAVPSDEISLAGGQFGMGSNLDCNDLVGGVACKGDRANHLVKISPFILQATEVSQIQYASCALTGACPPQGTFDPRRKDQPMYVDDPGAARAYCISIGARLPTEAEFEFAARVDSSGMEHVYPWGNDPVSCAKVNMAGCSAAFGYNVGDAPGDVTDTGIHDLAGGAPEWVDDHYEPFVGCLDRVGYSDLCFGESQSCPELRCAADDKYCGRGCMPPSEDLSSPAHGGQVTSTPSCPLPSAQAAVSIDPIVRTATGLASVRGGSFLDGACAFAGFTRRHAVPHRYLAGFRCARSASQSTPPTPQGSYRFQLSGCPAPDAATHLALATDQNPNASFQLDWFPTSAGPLQTMQSNSGAVDGVPCGAFFVLHPTGPTPLTVTVKVTSMGTCMTATRQLDLTAGGDVPPIGADAIVLSNATCM